jgi:hypothetical protein
MTISLSTSSSAQTQRNAGTVADFSGVWLTPGGYNGRPESEWSTERLPFTPKGRQAFDANKPGKGPRQGPPALGNDPIGGANPPGLYRTLIYNRPFEIVQLRDKVVQLFEWSKVWRVIYTDGRPAPNEIPAGPYWYGYSTGKWQGGTLVVTTIGLDERAWFDEWGTPISPDAKIEERWQKTAPGKLQLKIAVNDPAFYSKAWTSSPIVYTIQKKMEPLEIIMSPMDEAVFNERIRNPAGSPGRK